MTKLEEYANKYENIRMERRDGILQVTLHTNGGTLKWGIEPHRDLGHAFEDIGSDPENRIIILTGTGDDYCAEYPPGPKRFKGNRGTPMDWDTIYWEGKRLLFNLLDIEVPMIAAVNGPALIHAEVPLLCDVVLASENAAFQDAPHFPNGLVPGDGVHVVFLALLGPNRGRYFLLTGQKLSAREALDLGLVGEVLPRERLLPRAWELAEDMSKRGTLTLRYTRTVMTMELKRLMHNMLGYGLQVEGLAALNDFPA